MYPYFPTTDIRCIRCDKIFRTVQKKGKHACPYCGCLFRGDQEIKRRKDMMSEEKFTFFFREESPFSQWHRASFVLDGQTFNCCEQAMMYKKALLFGDLESASSILLSAKPYEQKLLGRKVKGFIERIWKENCKNIVYEINYAKFTQNPDLLKQLMDTQGTTLAEASPYDRVWGIGLKANDPRAKVRSQWLGTNWLGEILTQLREDLIRNED